MDSVRDETIGHGCPTPATLESFCLGRLPSEEVDAVGAHAADCLHCAALLDQLAARDDPFVAELRQPARPTALTAAERQRAADLAATARLDETVTGPGRSATPVTGRSAPRAMPERLGQYQLLEQLGEGGMGQVFKARHILMNRVVALKVIRGGLLDQPEIVQRFQREIQALGRLKHSNLVSADYADREGDMHFLVMEFVEGETLTRQVREHGPLGVAAACACVRQVADALAHARAHGMVHRDLKPSNIIRTPAGEAKLLDLGLARFQDECTDRDVTATRAAIGTPDYMAPEQWDDAHTVDIRADLYSLGCTLYFMLAGQPPFGGPAYDSPSRKMKAHIAGTVPPIRQLRPDVPAPIVAILDRLLAKDPADRFQTPAELVAALTAVERGDGLSPTNPPRRTRRRPVAIALASIAAVAAAAAITWLAVARPWLAAPTDPPVAPAAANGAPVAASLPAVPAVAANAQAGAPAAAAEPELRITSMRTIHLRGEQNLGDLGLTSLATRFDDDVRVSARFSAPAHCYLIAYNADGKEQLCYPSDANLAPAQMPELQYPKDKNVVFALNDGVGMQAFVLVASRQSLPPYAQWQADHGQAPWQQIEAPGVWRYADREFELLPRERGLERPRSGTPPGLQKLAAFFQGQAGADALQIMAFPVHGKAANP